MAGRRRDCLQACARRPRGVGFGLSRSLGLLARLQEEAKLLLCVGVGGHAHDAQGQGGGQGHAAAEDGPEEARGQGQREHLRLCR